MPLPEHYPTLLSSCLGEITSILLVYPGLASAAGDLEYREIEEVFSPRGKVYRFRQEVPQFSIRLSRLRGEYRAPQYREIKELRPSMDMGSLLQSWRDEMKAVEREGVMTFRRWAQDPFVVLESGHWTVLLDSLNNRRMCDFFLPLEIAAQAGPMFAVRPTRLFLEGGNILRGADATFVGQDMIDENAIRLGIKEAEVLVELQKALGVEDIIPVWLPTLVPCLRADGGSNFSTRQPLFHIDMFITPGGKDAITGQEIVFVADARLGVNALHSLQNPKVSLSETQPEAPELFDVVAKELTRLGLHVVRLPIAFFNDHTYTWNNALVEQSGKLRRIFLPSYQAEHDPERLNPSFECLENLVQEIYENAGFEVHWFKSGRLFRTLAQQGGSLHCAVKVVSRHRPDADAPSPGQHARS